MAIDEKELKKLSNWASYCPEHSFSKPARVIILKLITEIANLRRQLAAVDRYKQIG